MMAQMLGARLEGDWSTIVANRPGMGARALAFSSAGLMNSDKPKRGNG